MILGADSLDVVELVMELEDEFDMEISDEDAEKITTVGEVVNYISISKCLIKKLISPVIMTGLISISCMFKVNLNMSKRGSVFYR